MSIFSNNNNFSIIQGIDPNNECLVFFKLKDGTIAVNCNICGYEGSLDEFKENIHDLFNRDNLNPELEEYYLSIISLMKSRFKIKE